MKLHMGNVWTRVSGADEDELEWLRRYLSITRVSFQGAKRRVEQVSLYSDRRGAFPAGFTPLVIDAARNEEGFGAAVQDDRGAVPPADPKVDLSWLRDYQRDGLDKVLAAGRGIVRWPTGSGKGELAAALPGYIRSVPWLFLVSSSQLARDVAGRFERRFGEPAGRIGDGEWTERRFTCATFQTMSAAWRTGPGTTEHERAKHLLLAARGLIVDEVHQLPADTYTPIVYAAANAYYRVGLSATPLDRGDNRSTVAVGAIGPIVHRVSPQELIDRGLIAQPEIRMIEVVQNLPKPGHRIRAQAFKAVYDTGIVKSALRNRVLVRMVAAAAKPALVFVQRLDHAKTLLKALGGAGYRMDVVTGSASAGKRDSTVQRFDGGDLDVLLASGVFQQGIDIQRVAAIVNAGGGQSVIATVQRIGRGSRTAGGEKSTFEVWDVRDRTTSATAEDGSLTADWLDDHAAARQRAYLREGYKVLVGELGGRMVEVKPRQRRSKEDG